MRPRVHQRGSGNAAMKKARGTFARASYAVLVNTEFVEDSVTRSQAFSRSRARKMRFPCKQQEKNRDARIPVARMSHKRVYARLRRATATCGTPDFAGYETARARNSLRSGPGMTAEAKVTYDPRLRSRRYALDFTTFCRCSPSPSIPSVTTSPALRNFG